MKLHCTAKIRYRQKDNHCHLEASADDDGTRYIVHFDEGQRAITPGQSVVFYDGDVCLGGGVIETMYNQDSSKKVSP